MDTWKIGFSSFIRSDINVAVVLHKSLVLYVLLCISKYVWYCTKTAALAQKNSEATRVIAAQQEILEKELGEIQKVLLAMQVYISIIIYHRYELVFVLGS